MYARSVENHVYTITANRIGAEARAGRELTFTGGSQVLGLDGQCRAKAGRDTEEVGLADVDPALADDKTIADHNDLFADRRSDLYSGLGR